MAPDIYVKISDNYIDLFLRQTVQTYQREQPP